MIKYLSGIGYCTNVTNIFNFLETKITKGIQGVTKNKQYSYLNYLGKVLQSFKLLIENFFFCKILLGFFNNVATEITLGCFKNFFDIL